MGGKGRLGRGFSRLFYDTKYTSTMVLLYYTFLVIFNL